MELKSEVLIKIEMISDELNQEFSERAGSANGLSFDDILDFVSFVSSKIEQDIDSVKNELIANRNNIAETYNLECIQFEEFKNLISIYLPEEPTKLASEDSFRFELQNKLGLDLKPKTEAKGRIEESQNNLSTNDNKYDEIKNTLLDTIRSYERMLGECKNENERDVLKSLIDSLKEKLRALDSRTDRNNTLSSINASQFRKREDKKIAALREIFSFYTRQQGVPGLLFVKLEQRHTRIAIGKVLMIIHHFLVDFDAQDYVSHTDKEIKRRYLMENRDIKKKVSPAVQR